MTGRRAATQPHRQRSTRIVSTRYVEGTRKAIRLRRMNCLGAALGGHRPLHVAGDWAACGHCAFSSPYKVLSNPTTVRHPEYGVNQRTTALRSRGVRSNLCSQQRAHFRALRARDVAQLHMPHALAGALQALGGIGQVDAIS